MNTKALGVGMLIGVAVLAINIVIQFETKSWLLAFLITFALVYALLRLFGEKGET